MKFILTLLFGKLLLLLSATSAYALADVTERALKLYEKHHYEDAAKMLRPELSGMDAQQKAKANLALGMIYLGSSTLYQDLYQTALVIELDYLSQLAKQRSGNPSRYVDQYYGQALREAGKTTQAIKYLSRFAGKSGVSTDSKTFARIDLGIAYHQQQQSSKAFTTWAGVDKSKPHIKAALAGAYAMTGELKYNPVSMVESALSELKKQGKVSNLRVARDVLSVYGVVGEPDKALDFLSEQSLGNASYVETLGASKSVSFYDPGLLDSLAKVYARASVMYLERAAKDEKLAAVASYYLIDAYLQQNNVAMSLRGSEQFLSQSKLPASYKNLARLSQARAKFLSGQQAAANAIWFSIAESANNDSELQAKAMLSCVQVSGDCVKLEKLLLLNAEKGEGKKYFPVSAALGKYYMSRKDGAKAMLYLEAGRDKANKNKIEANDPLFMVGLAEASYQNKKFSEALEIYFELGKQFPAVRQIQDAMQGIYVLEQKSAGEVKIF